MRQEPIAYINVEQRKLEFAKPIMWHTPTVVNLERIPLYTHQRTWQGLTDEEVESYWDWEDFQTGAGRLTILEMVRDIEAKLKEKNF